MRVWAGQPLAVVVGAALVALLVPLGRRAHHDQQRGAGVLALRAVVDDELPGRLAVALPVTLQEQLPAALAQRGVTATATEVPPPPQPRGPPFDEDLLPIPDHCVGREADLTWVLGRLRTGGATAITALGGMGGIGKTSLAAAAIRRLRAEGRFPDGVAVVLCQDLTDPTEVLRRVLTRFDAYRKAPKETSLADLARKASFALKGKDALLVLDNVEPELAAAEVVAPLRAAALTLLLTARQALPPAAIPADGSRQLDLLAAGEALRVFADALGRGSVDALSPADHTAAERIVAALDRHTLAVKLAGAYAAQARRDLGVLARELEDPEHGLDLPEGEAPRAVARVFAQSTAALPEDARRLFAALGAFATPEFGRRAALALATGVGQIDPRTSVDLLVLRALVEASVDETLPEDADRERLRLHPLLRAFADGLFARWPESERAAASEAVARHLAAYAVVNRTRVPVLAVDEGNLTGALAWAHACNLAEVTANLANGLRQFWLERTRLRDGARGLEWGSAAANVVARADGSRAARALAAELCLAYGAFLNYTGQPEAGDRALRTALDGFRASGDRQGEGTALAALGDVAARSGQYATAEDALRDALAIQREVGDRPGEATTLWTLAHVALLRGRHDTAEVFLQESLAIRRAVGDRQGEGIDLCLLGRVALMRERVQVAEECLRQALTNAREIGSARLEAQCLVALGRVAEAVDEPSQAEISYRNGLDLAIERGLGPESAAAQLALGRLLAERLGLPEEGRPLIVEAVRRYAEMGLPEEREAREVAWRLGGDV